MAYGKKYHHIYCDKHGNSYEIAILQQDYEGSSELVEGARDPWSVSREDVSELKTGSVLPQKASASFVSEGAFNLQELYTAQEDTYLLVRYKNGSLDWQGSIIPNGFSENTWDDDRPILTVSASDNLSTLKGKQFVDQYGDNYGDSDTHVKSFLWAITESLKKTGFLMPIWTLVDLKPTLEDDSEIYTVRALVNTTHNSVTIIDYNRVVKDTLANGVIIKINEWTFGVDSFIMTPSFSYDLFNITPDTTLTGDTFNGDTSMTVSTPQDPIDISDPLYHTMHDVRVWINDANIEGKSYYEARGGAMNTWDVLDAIARQWGVKIQQNGGHWEVCRWNVDKLPDGTFQWFVYNSEGTPIGRQPYYTDRLLPCRPTESEYRIYGTSINMDRVFRRAIVNYRFKYKQEGDSLRNLIVNGNFDGVLNPNPRGWDKIHVDSVTTIPPMQISKVTTGLPEGFSDALRIESYADSRLLTNLTVLSNTEVNKGDKLTIRWYERVDGITGTNLNDSYCGIYSIAIYESLDHAFATSIPGGASGGGGRDRGSRGKIFCLANSGEFTTGRPPDQPAPVKSKFKARWRDLDEDGSRGQGVANRFATYYSLVHTAPQYGRWRLVEVEVDEVPINGFLKFGIIGVAWNIRWEFGSITQGDIRKTPVFTPASTSLSNILGGAYEMKYKTICGALSGVSMVTTGFFVGKIVDPDNDVVPQIDPFMYPDDQAQLSRSYTDTIPEIEVLTGDDYGDFVDDRISGMTWGGQRTSMWDTWDNRFGWSRQGLITAKSIMEMYWKPTRLINCEIGIKDVHWSTRFQFEELPGKRFVILRGSIGGQNETFTGTLTEIHDEADAPLPPGGNDGGNTTQPNWQANGITRCSRDDDGLNTGMVEIVEVDVNMASPTFGQQRWVDGGEDLGMCPIGDAIEIYWGEQFSLDVNGLRYFPYEKEDDLYRVTYTNNDSDVYLRLLHRADLGTVRSITYENGMESIGAWVYEPDETINGYIYKSLRINWFTGVFTDLPVIFKIN